MKPREFKQQIYSILIKQGISYRQIKAFGVGKLLKELPIKEQIKRIKA